MRSDRPIQALLDIALDLSAGLSRDDRYRRLTAAVRRVVPCDAVALMWLDGDALVPLATVGLAPEVRGRRFVVAEHPRLAAIVESRAPVRFAADDPRPDPYDGLVADVHAEHLDVHACMGSSLHVGGELIGAMTVDALRPGSFDDIDDDMFATFAALAAATMRTAALIDALEQTAARRQDVARQLVAEALERGGAQLLGTSDAIARLRDEVDAVADSGLTTLITGETGTGKELVARTLHARSPRADQPLVYVNCAALPETVAESELFGHVRGAFTGATGDRAGKFELADGGTLFLDEVGELPLSVQPTLLRALQFGEIQRVGADREIRVDVRVIAATNRDLSVELKAGRFRADLYHRLSVYPIHVAPLRERGADDILLLSGHFLDRARAQLGLGPVSFAADARAALTGYAWPGNVRELEHVIQRAIVRALGRGGVRRDASVRVTAFHLALGAAAPPALAVAEPAAAQSLADATAAFQRAAIERALAGAGSWSGAARRLGMDRSNLRRLARRVGASSDH